MRPGGFITLLLIVFTFFSLIQAKCPSQCPECRQRTRSLRDLPVVDEEVVPLQLEEGISGMGSSDLPLIRAKRSGSKPPQTNASDFEINPVANFGPFESQLPAIINFEETTFRGAKVFVFRIDNPLHHVFVLPALDSKCPKDALTTDTAKVAECIVATNAGFFERSTGDCIGNVISKGKQIQISGLENANFGITKDGKFIVGYLTQEDVTTNRFGFSELISGMLWLVRDYQPYYCESYDIELPYDYFLDRNAARTILGHDGAGRLFLISVEGDEPTGKGLNIYNLADLALHYNLKNVVNLDGGGSVTVYYQGNILNQLTDRVKGTTEGHERAVTTIMCVK